MKYIYKIPKSILRAVEVDGKNEQVEMETCLEGEIHLNLPGLSKLPEIARMFQDKLKNDSDELSQLKSVIELLNAHVEKVFAKSGELLFECLDDLACTVEGRAVALSLVSMITKGVQLGELKKA